MTSCTPGISSNPISTRPWFPVMPIAVRCAPGMLCGRSPCASIFLHTARTCSSVACACITTNIACLRKHQFSRARGRNAETECPALPSILRVLESKLYSMPRSIAQEQDILKLPAPKSPPQLTSRRIGIHTSTSGGVETAAERAYRLGCNTFQIFSSSPRMWKPYQLAKTQCDEMIRLREKYGIVPLVIHTSYLVNLASVTQEFLTKSIEAFRGEVERGMALGAQYLVLHAGSYRGLRREEGLARAAESIQKATEGLDLEGCGFKVLIENSAGAEYSLGSSFEQVAELVERLRPVLPVAACMDTCHMHAAGYDIDSTLRYEYAMKYLESTIGLKNIPVWHCNDAKS